MGMVGSRNQTICNRITEWHEGECDEGRDCIPDISPVDAGYLAHHHAPNLSRLVAV